MRLSTTRPEIRRTALAAAALALAGGLAGCLATAPQNVPASTGAAGGATSEGADARLQTCAQPVGTVRLQDGSGPATAPAAPTPVAAAAPGIGGLLSMLAGQGGQQAAAAPGPSVSGASLDSMRLLIQQSNCFVILDRGASEAAADDEKQRARKSGEVRDDANMGPGQEVAADYVMRSSIIQLETTDSRGLNVGVITKFLGTASASQSKTKARVQLVVSAVRSKAQVAVAQGEGAGSNTSLATNLLGRMGKVGGAGGLSSDSKTSGTTILLQAFADAYNKLVPAVQNYKAQEVRGGLGTGGTLGVQGSRSDPSGAPR